jgi:SAM-dependent methyltransferase
MRPSGVFGERPLRDAIKACSAIATNQLARFAPRFYAALTRKTGRGDENASPEDTARYFLQCVQEYVDRLGGPHADTRTFFRDLRVVEYGPGDIPAIGLLLIALGARSVTCVDRFSLVKFDEFQQRTIAQLYELLPDDEARSAMRECFRRPGDFGSGFKAGRFEYVVSRSGLLGRRQVADLVLSRAVLEHVNNLPATIADTAEALVPGGRAVHLVDLRSHGFHRGNRFDFLTWPEWLWHLMFSAKGAPNRIRIDRYRDTVQRSGLILESIEITEAASSSEIEQVRPYLAAPFRCTHERDLVCLGFWISCRRPLTARGEC